ncbi:MAG: YIP1 family protein [Clostridia bacterium]|nr:YIP1 family protein [Clostridia bacterium]
MKKALKYTVVFLLIFVLSALTLMPVVSAEDYESLPYDTYAYWTKNQGLEREAVPIRSIFEVADYATGYDMGTTELSEPTDIAVDSKGNVYILDSDNGRVVKLTPELKLAENGIIEFPQVDGETLDFTLAQGIYIDRKTDVLYICDTDNNRVLIFDAAGKFLNKIEKPDSAVIPEDFHFQPIKVVVDSRGDTFILCRDSNYGAVVFDKDGNFLSFYGYNFVQATVLDFLEKMWDRLTQTEAKREASVKKVPFQFISMDIDSNDFIYTLTGFKGDEIYSSGTGQIRRLNPSGANIYINNSGSTSETLDFTDFNSDYLKTGGLQPYLTEFQKLCVDDDGYIYAVDKQFGHIFVYDSQCNNIGVFGGGGLDFTTAGQTAGGTFNRAVSVATYGDRLYVVDAGDCSITTFRKTEYGKLYMQAQLMTQKGLYSESKPLWEKVLQQDKNNQLAYWGLAQAALFEGEYSQAMQYAKTGLDQVDYAVAFQQKRSEFFAKNVWWIIILAVVLMIAAVVVAHLRKGKEKNLDHPVRFAFDTVLHPFDAFYRMKYKGAGSFVTALVLMVLYYVSMVVSDMYAGFSFSIFDPSDYNSLLTLVRTVGLILGWTFVNWGVCILAQGKGRMKEIFMVTCYAVIPEILGCVLKLIFTNVLVPEEAAIMTVILVCCHILTAVVLCVGIMAIHEYDFFRFLWTTILTVLGLLLVVFIIFMVFILTQELTTFVSSIVKEALYK